MRRDNLAGLASTTIATAMLLAGCSGGSQVGSSVSPMSAGPPQQQSVFVRPRAKVGETTSWMNRPRRHERASRLYLSTSSRTTSPCLTSMEPWKVKSVASAIRKVSLSTPNTTFGSPTSAQTMFLNSRVVRPRRSTHSTTQAPDRST